MGSRTRTVAYRTRSKTDSSKGRSRRWLRLCLWGTLALLILPILQCAFARWFTPPGTPLMLVRKVEAWAAKKTPAPVRYEWRSLRAIPKEYLLAVLIAEDQRFFQHRGFDWKEVRAAQQAAERSGKPPRGASTISMQCARSLFLWQGRSWIRKGLEVYYTFWMELLLSKRRILELHVNCCEMGDGIYGVGAAARTYYNVDASRLSADQSVRLAALLPAPLQWSPRVPSPRYSARIERLNRERQSAVIPGFASLGR